VRPSFSSIPFDPFPNPAPINSPHNSPLSPLVACGSISTYNASPTNPAYRIQNYSQVVRRRVKWQGFLVLDPNIRKWAKERDDNVSRWILDGSFKSVDYVTYGIDNAVDGFLGMLKGDNLGKSILQIADA